MAIRTKTRIDFEDYDLEKRVERFVYSRDATAYRDIDIEVLEGVVTLRGSVTTFYEKQVVLNTCRRVAGVLGVIDKILVSQPTRRAK